MGWDIEQRDSIMRLRPRSLPSTQRAMGSERFTWADLLYEQLRPVQVFVLYFPSRFDRGVDAQVRGTLEVFGRETPPSTSVNFWDTTDPDYSSALAFFHLPSPPALVLATGQVVARGRRPARDVEHLYSIALTDPQLLGDKERLVAAINRVHEVLIRADRGEITRYLVAQDAEHLLALLGRLGSGLVDVLVKLKPKLALPGGSSIQLGA
jgi:hypothetical protein